MAFLIRNKLYQSLTTLEGTLIKKREYLAKYQHTNKIRADKIAGYQAELVEMERQVEEDSLNFQKVSASLNEDLENFEIQRLEDSKETIKAFLGGMLDIQKQVTWN